MNKLIQASFVFMFVAGCFPPAFAVDPLTLSREQQLELLVKTVSGKAKGADSAELQARMAQWEKDRERLADVAKHLDDQKSLGGARLIYEAGKTASTKEVIRVPATAGVDVAELSLSVMKQEAKLQEVAFKVAQVMDLRAKVNITSSRGPGALVMYEAPGDRVVHKAPVSFGATTQIKGGQIGLGYFYMWCERDGAATSSRDRIVAVLTMEEQDIQMAETPPAPQAPQTPKPKTPKKSKK